MDGITSVGGRDLSPESEDFVGPDQQERSKDQPKTRRALKKLGQLPTFWTIGKDERENIIDSLKRPLSGYLGGNSRAGYWIERLSDEWSTTFGSHYSIPCNSATSGLLAACLAAGIEEGDLVWVSDYTMSASATCALLLGAEVVFQDIGDLTFCINPAPIKPWPKAIIATNLFGHPAQLTLLRTFCDENKIILIEDNAQAPFAKQDGKYTGTIGHMGVFSLNVHKHIQCGEGGVVCTDSPELAHRLDCAINHGELMRNNPHMGLNLRMTEPIAAIASAQLKKGSHIVQTRINLAYQISSLFDGIDWVETPYVRPDCDHVFYLWAGKIKGDDASRRRAEMVNRLRSRGVPFKAGYSIPLHRLFEPPEFETHYPVTCEMEDARLFTFEICAYDPNRHHLKTMKEIIQQEAEKCR